MHKIIDNFIETNLIEKIKSVCLSSEFAWYYTPYVSNKDAGDGIYFSHLVYNNFSPSSSCFNLFIPVLDFLSAKSLIRIKINMFPKTPELFQHDWHSDYDFDHKGAVVFLNSNNGFTILKDNTMVNSLENRILLFDSSKPHRSTTCTDQNVRLTVNFNYF